MITSAIFLIKTWGEILRSLYTISPGYTVGLLLMCIFALILAPFIIRGAIQTANDPELPFRRIVQKRAAKKKLKLKQGRKEDFNVGEDDGMDWLL